jgi:hypothetical protein
VHAGVAMTASAAAPTYANRLVMRGEERPLSLP